MLYVRAEVGVREVRQVVALGRQVLDRLLRLAEHRPLREHGQGRVGLLQRLLQERDLALAERDLLLLLDDAVLQGDARLALLLDDLRERVDLLLRSAAPHAPADELLLRDAPLLQDADGVLGEALQLLLGLVGLDLELLDPLLGHGVLPGQHLLLVSELPVAGRARPGLRRGGQGSVDGRPLGLRRALRRALPLRGGLGRGLPRGLSVRGARGVDLRLLLLGEAAQGLEVVEVRLDDGLSDLRQLRGGNRGGFGGGGGRGGAGGDGVCHAPGRYPSEA